VIGSIPSSSVNVLAPYAPVGRSPVSQETNDLKSSTFKATEQLAESGRGLNRRQPDERPNEDAEQDRVLSDRVSISDEAQEPRQGASDERQQTVDRKKADELAARDREVRAHEQAHAAVAGQYAGSTTYTFVRGPDGVSYAVGGEVSIDTSPVPGDPEATIRKAQQISRAANAPADPSGQDRSVAAQAAQMEQAARIELREVQALKAKQREEQVSNKEDKKEVAEDKPSTSVSDEQRKVEEEREIREQEQFEEEQRLLDQRRARAELFGQIGKKNVDLNRKLIDIGVFESAIGRGALLNKTV